MFKISIFLTRWKLWVNDFFSTQNFKCLNWRHTQSKYYAVPETVQFFLPMLGQSNFSCAPVLTSAGSENTPKIIFPWHQTICYRNNSKGLVSASVVVKSVSVYQDSLGLKRAINIESMFKNCDSWIQDIIPLKYDQLSMRFFCDQTSSTILWRAWRIWLP